MDSLRFLHKRFGMFKRAAFRGEHPSETSLTMTLYCLRLIGVWQFDQSIICTLVNVVYTAALLFFIVTITCDLYEASSDIITFGDDLCILVALYMVFFKLILFRISKSRIERIASEFEHLHWELSSCSQAVKEIQRFEFVREIAIVYTYMVLGYFLFIAIAFQPMLSGQSGMLPFRAKFPFSIDDKRVFMGVYLFQCACTLINVKLILFIDSIGVMFNTQSSANLKALCQRMREMSHTMTSAEFGKIIADHQTIIRLVEDVNECNYLNYVAQVSGSTFLICLTAFEAQLAEDQPLVALKFQTFMFSSFMQLLYWCWTGSRVQVDSLAVAEVAYECEWVARTNGFRRDLMFVIQRAQKPLAIRAQPFYGFDFESFSNILSTSYSYFTLLRTLSD